MKKRILIFIGCYLPGYKYGGPLRTVDNLTELLGDEYDLRVVCLDRDLGDSEPYKNIKYNDWNLIGKAKVWYLSPGGFTFSTIRKFAKDAVLIYSCGFYDAYCYKSLILKRLGLLKNVRVAVASMGVFSPGALALKRMKKKIFITVCKWLGLFKNIVWSVTSELEKADVKYNIGNDTFCIIAEDIPQQKISQFRELISAKKLNVAFLSRISPMKNLCGAITALQKIECPVDFTIYGPLEDEKYWQFCLRKLENLPAHVQWNYAGNVPADDVVDTLGKHDVFLFPTLGENYGHVIFEALAAGCIPVISDQTPWRCVADAGAGYILPLSEEMSDFVEALNAIAEKSESERITMMECARDIAAGKIAEVKKHTGYRTIFDGNY